MKWIKVDKNDDFPPTDVLAISDRNDMLIGYLANDRIQDTFLGTGVMCNGDTEILTGVTHYMELPEPPKRDSVK